MLEVLGTNCTQRIPCCFTLIFWHESVRRKPPPQEEIPRYATDSDCAASATESRVEPELNRVETARQTTRTQSLLDKIAQEIPLC